MHEHLELFLHKNYSRSFHKRVLRIYIIKKHTFAYLVHLAKCDKMNYAEINYGNTSLMWVLSPLFRWGRSKTVPYCTRVKNTSKRFYILPILQKVSRSRMINQNSKYFLAKECVCSRKASWCICIIKLAWYLKEPDVNEIHFERSLGVNRFNIFLFMFDRAKM